MGMEERDRFPARRAALLDAHDAIGETHARLKSEPSALVTQREHRDDLIEHRDALARFHEDLGAVPGSQRPRLELTKAASETEFMLAETLETIERSREAWKRATDAWQRVRERLDR
jgi:hypothetical protein